MQMCILPQRWGPARGLSVWWRLCSAAAQHRGRRSRDVCPTDAWDGRCRTQAMICAHAGREHKPAHPSCAPASSTQPWKAGRPPLPSQGWNAPCVRQHQRTPARSIRSYCTSPAPPDLVPGPVPAATAPAAPSPAARLGCIPTLKHCCMPANHIPPPFVLHPSPLPRGRCCRQHAPTPSAHTATS